MIDKQIELEKEMISTGLQRYRTIVDKSKSSDRGSETGYATTLIRKYVEPVGGYILDKLNQTGVGRRNKYYGFLKHIDPYMAAYIALKGMFNYFMSDKALVTVAVKIGQSIEDQIKFDRFERKYPKYYDAIINDFKRKNTNSYRHRHRVLDIKFREKGMEWNDWTSEERMQVGMILLDCIMTITDLAEKKSIPFKKSKFKETTIIVPTESCSAWINKYIKYAEVLHPDRLPCVVPPLDWTNMTDGGYYLPMMRKRTPLVKVRSKKHLDMLENGQISSVVRSVNTLQRIPYRINKRILEAFISLWQQGNDIVLPKSTPYIIPDCPVPRDVPKAMMTETQYNEFMAWKSEAAFLYTKEKERAGKALLAARVLSTAVQYSKFDEFYFVWQADFRGRLYAISAGINPHGIDFSKALLEYATGKPVNEETVKWLKVHGANQFGVDKVSFADRVQWVHDNQDKILLSAQDPERHIDFWGTADSPFQFLAFCLEYKTWCDTGELVSHLPIAKDGSCNGLQHFSAMLRDEVTAQHVNLTPGEKPADVYSVVGERATQRVLAESHSAEQQLLKDWLDKLGVTSFPRSLAKKPVMTLPYGATKNGMTDGVCSYLTNETDSFFQKKDCFGLAMYLTPRVWDSINDTCSSAREVMDWLQKSATVLAKAGHPVSWITPTGFPVYQDRKKTKVRTVNTQLQGRLRINVADDSPVTCSRAQSRSIAPNFVHSLDANHLIYTLTLLNDIDNTVQLLPVHDSYATHCSDIPLLDACIREAFILLYSKDVLEDYRIYIHNTYNVELPPLPNKGKLDLNTVRDSMYFFN